jgi:hypothetical protein
MRFRVLAAALGLVLVSCTPETKSPAPETPAKAEISRPADESRRFPGANLVDTRLVERELMGKPFMPGGTLAHYRKGKNEYSMFLARLPSATDAAILLLDWNKALSGARLIPSFGGYFGQDAGRPVFVFSKGAWIAGVAGLPEKDADLAARALAAHLN